MSAALTLVKVLRRLPHSANFDRHLTDCAALAVLYRPIDPTLPPLRIAHVLRLRPLPSVDPSLPDPVAERVHVPIATDNIVRLRRDVAPEVFEAG